MTGTNTLTSVSSDDVPAPRALVVDGLHAGYGAVRVLDGLSLTVDRGESLALLGPNGAGKTTFVLAVAGLLPGTQGAISFHGRSVQRLSAARRARLGLVTVTQARDLFGDLPVNENLQLGARCRMGRREYDVDDIYELFPILHGKRRARARDLSGGQQQMLAIGRALLGCPRILVLDEPSAGLSEGILATVESAIIELKRRGLALLMVEQRLDLALAACDRYAVLSQGEIVLGGATEDTDLAELERQYFATEKGSEV